MPSAGSSRCRQIGLISRQCGEALVDRPTGSSLTLRRSTPSSHGLHIRAPVAQWNKSAPLRRVRPQVRILLGAFAVAMR
jgi:hypothetical protein